MSRFITVIASEAKQSMRAPRAAVPGEATRFAPVVVKTTRRVAERWIASLRSQ
jgi:hypothetical protein